MSSAGNLRPNCATVQEHLSAFHDRELPFELAAAVREHLKCCPQCAQRFAEFQALSRIGTELPSAEVPPRIWRQIERQLSAQVQSQCASLIKSIHRRHPWAALVTAALVIVIVTTATVALFRGADHDAGRVAVNFGRYLDEFELNPAAAQHVLLSNYDGRAVHFEEAVSQVRYRPATPQRLPDGLSREALYLLRMPCCTCVQAVYQRDDGRKLAVFEHVDDQPGWFGHRPTIKTRCNGMPASLVQVDDRLAATWRRQGRFITVVGANDVDEVLELVAFLDDQPAR
ncbi:MAG: zf-HC2 domain-containing protein [Pirellulales bacterium]|nr:zf-HC2 domain-containing protein [Pirellulales bacterium]